MHPRRIPVALAAITLVAVLTAAAAPRGARAAPACGSDAFDSYRDSLTENADRASSAGRHTEAMRLYEERASYEYRCVDPATAAVLSGHNAQIDMSGTMRSFLYTSASGNFMDAAAEAKAAGRKADRCRLARRGAEAAKRAYPNEKLSPKYEALLRGC
jgi:hypothetical protein